MATGTNITSEVVWNELATNEGATGGGISDAFGLPSYQSAAGVPRRLTRTTTPGEACRMFPAMPTPQPAM